jgi:TonB family protein
MKKILVIDYDQSSLASLQGTLTEEGYTVVTACDGQTGWDKYNRESPDLVLLEAMLPKVHGFELCQRITAERNSQATVFIMTGVYKDRVYRTEALRTYGASGYFEKPLKMAELLSSIEAVIGKATPKPAEAGPAEAVPVRPVKAGRPESPKAAPRKIERIKDDGDEFSLPDDLVNMQKESPKIKTPAPVRREPSLETRLDSIADELRRTAAAVPHHHPKAAEEKPREHGGNNGNGHESVDIDKILKSALADFDLDREKVKVPKTAPLPPPPRAAAAPAVEKPKPAPEIAVKPRPATPPPPPAAAFSRPSLVVPTGTIIPGDPGSDSSPFFSPEKPKPSKPGDAAAATPQARPAEKPKAQTPPPPPAAAAPQPSPATPRGTIIPGDPGSDSSPFFTPEKPRPSRPKDVAAAPPQARPAEKPKAQTPPPPPVVTAPAPKPHRPEDKAEHKAAAPVFSDLVEQPEKKRSFSPLLAVGAGVAVVAIAGFLILKPKPPAPAAGGNVVSQQAVPAPIVKQEPVVEAPPPEVKPKPAARQPRVETKTTVSNIGPSSEDAIIVPAAMTGAPAILGSPNPAAADTDAKPAGSAAAQSEPPPVKTEEAPPQVQSAGGETGTAEASGSAAEAPAAVPAAVKEGDLVDLSAVDEQPKVLKSPDPVYPPTAQRLGVEGSITVNALIDEKGNVIDTGILKGMKDDKGLGKAAETAVSKWKFQPARKGGVNVKVWKAFVIVFKTANGAPK